MGAPRAVATSGGLAVFAHAKGLLSVWRLPDTPTSPPPSTPASTAPFAAEPSAVAASAAGLLVATVAGALLAYPPLGVDGAVAASSGITQLPPRDFATALATIAGGGGRRAAAFAAACASGRLRLLDAAGTLLVEVAAHSRLCAAVAADASGRRVASAGEDGTLLVWDVAPAAGVDAGPAVTCANSRWGGGVCE